MKPPIDADSLQEIIRHYDSDERLITLDGMEIRGPLSLADSIMLQARLERAVMNQVTDGEATLSRYAIWAETVRGIVLDALEKPMTTPIQNAT